MPEMQPCEQRGLQSACSLVEVGLGEVPEPLGYTRSFDPDVDKYVVAYQPDGTAAKIFQVKTRYPIIGETDSEFMVQIEGRVRGFVSKNEFFRTLTDASVASVETSPSALAQIITAGAVAALGAAGGLVTEAYRDAYRNR